VEYLAVGGVMLVVAGVALVFILGMRAVAESRSQDGDADR
jgi:hypothetical protein